MKLPSRVPGVVQSYDSATRTCKVAIEGMTTGAESLHPAEIEYPIGHRPKGNFATEIEILEGDLVWLAFIGDDERHPIITGSRCPHRENSVGTRRIHQSNIELIANNLWKAAAATIEFVASTLLKINAPSTEITGNLKITGDVEITGKFNVTGDEFKHNSLNVGSTHKHSGVLSGSSKTGIPE